MGFGKKGKYSRKEGYQGIPEHPKSTNRSGARITTVWKWTIELYFEDLRYKKWSVSHRSS